MYVKWDLGGGGVYEQKIENPHDLHLLASYLTELFFKEINGK